MKIFIRALLGFVILGLLLVALNFDKIKRLQTVNSLFDADKIVHNFSHMDEAFLHHDLDASSDTQIWLENPTPLPDMITINQKPYVLADVLKTLDTTAFIVVQDGKILNEQYFLGTEKDDLRISWSMAKSFMSGLYGQALQDGDITSLDETVETYAASLKGSAYEGATIRNVLNMASGVKFNEDYLDPKSDINDMGKILGLGGSMDKYTASLKDREAEPGERWKYVSIDTHVAAMVLRAATGKTLHQMFNETYSAHLGFDRAPYYLTDGKDVAFALGGLNLTTRDYAKFGQLFLQGGKWNGAQIIPADWAATSTRDSAPTQSDRGVGYGYQWWVPMPQDGPNKGDFFAVGIYGQYIYVNPQAGLVIAKNAADREFTQPMPEFGAEFGHSMNVNIAIFRSLADHYSTSPALNEIVAE